MIKLQYKTPFVSNFYCVQGSIVAIQLLMMNTIINYGTMEHKYVLTNKLVKRLNTPEIRMQIYKLSKYINLLQTTHSEILGYVKDAIKGLGYIRSKSLIHFDTKPSNILESDIEANKQDLV